MDNTYGIAKEAIELEKQFRENGCHGKKTNPPVLLKKGVGVMISAPHAVTHYRNGKVKLNEPYTGTLALQLAYRTGASAIIYARTTQEDANYDASGTYKQTLVELIK